MADRYEAGDILAKTGSFTASQRAQRVGKGGAHVEPVFRQNERKTEGAGHGRILSSDFGALV